MESKEIEGHVVTVEVTIEIPGKVDGAEGADVPTEYSINGTSESEVATPLVGEEG